jgi:hypothetical protein
VVGSCEHGNQTSSSIKDQEFLDKLSDCFSRRALLYEVSQLENTLIIFLPVSRIKAAEAKIYCKVTNFLSKINTFILEVRNVTVQPNLSLNRPQVSYNCSLTTGYEHQGMRL